MSLSLVSLRRHLKPWLLTLLPMTASRGPPLPLPEDPADTGRQPTLPGISACPARSGCELPAVTPGDASDSVPLCRNPLSSGPFISSLPVTYASRNAAAGVCTLMSSGRSIRPCSCPRSDVYVTWRPFPLSPSLDSWFRTGSVRLGFSRASGEGPAWSVVALAPRNGSVPSAGESCCGPRRATARPPVPCRRPLGCLGLERSSGRVQASASARRHSTGRGPLSRCSSRWASGGGAFGLGWCLLSRGAAACLKSVSWPFAATLARSTCSNPF